MKIAEPHIESTFLIQAEDFHRQAELAWFEGRTEDMLRFSEDARELMERYYASLESPDPAQESPRPPISLPRILKSRPKLEKAVVFGLIFLSAWGLTSFLNSLQGCAK
jgi:hypothetical protein